MGERLLAVLPAGAGVVSGGGEGRVGASGSGKGVHSLGEENRETWKPKERRATRWRWRRQWAILLETPGPFL